VTCTGYIVISKDELGFWSKNITQQDVKYRLRVADVQSVKSFHMNWRNLEGATLKFTNGHEAKFIFKSVAVRDEAAKRLNAILHPTGSTATGSTNSEVSSVEVIASEPSVSSILEAELTASPTSSLSPSPRPTPTRKDTVSVLAPLSRSLAAAIVASTKLPKSATDMIPKAINIPRDTLFTRKALHFVCLTIGSRGDVQPYIALGLGLKKEGHNVTIVTHEEYGDWIKGFGINHRTAGGDPGALMKLSVENKVSSTSTGSQRKLTVILL
jgi:sterol 3beta-glucosyltransferase